MPQGSYPSYLRRNNGGISQLQKPYFNPQRRMSKSTPIGNPTSYYQQTDFPEAVGLGVKRNFIMGKHATVMPNTLNAYSQSGAWRFLDGYTRMNLLDEVPKGNYPFYTEPARRANLELGIAAEQFSIIPVEGTLDSRLLTGTNVGNEFTAEQPSYGTIDTLANKIATMNN